LIGDDGSDQKAKRKRAGRPPKPKKEPTPPPPREFKTILRSKLKNDK